MPNSPTCGRSALAIPGRALAALLLAAFLSLSAGAASARAAEASTGAVAWGDNVYTELGAGYKDTIEERPVSVVGLENARRIALGYHFSAALMRDGTVETWGGNAFGQLGNGTHLTSGVPASVGLQGVKAIAVGGAHALALLEDGTIANWGDNEFGELGNGLLNPVKRLTRTGLTEWTMQGSGSQRPITVPNVKNVVSVAMGAGSAFALLSNGTVLAWGKNNNGQLGIGRQGPQVCKTEVGLVPCNTKPELVLLANHEPLHGVAAISAGSGAGYALLTSGKVMAWGDDGRGQLGNGSTTTSDVAVEVKGLTGVSALSAGGNFALALLGNGQVEGWGGDDNGQLGPVSGERCQTYACVKTPRLIKGLEHVSAVSGGHGFALALIAGKIYALGANEPFGQLGIGGLLSTNAPKPIEGLPPVMTMAAGEQHAVALLESGAAPAPVFSVTPAAGSLEVSWTVTAPVYGLRWRLFNKYTEGGGPWSPMVFFRTPCSLAAPCHYTIRGLSAVPYEVGLYDYVSSRVVFTRRAVATP